MSAKAAKTGAVNAVMSDSTLIFNVADSLNMVLHLMDDKAIKGYTPTKYTIGGFWNRNSDWLADSDEMSPAKAYSFFVRFIGDLWGYYVSSPQGLWLVLFDGDRVKLRTGGVPAFRTGSSSLTLAKIKPGACGAFFFDEGVGNWVESNILDKVLG